MFKGYMEYVRDNPQGLWFKRKLYGWGWTPVKWQGWLVMLAAVVLIIWNGVALGEEPAQTALIWFFVKLVAIVSALFAICYAKGEEPKWQWGPKKEESKQNGQ
jgi:hypothetical protein